MKKNLSLLVFAFISVWNLNAQTTLLSENFESGTQPAGWSQQTNATDGGWLFGTATTLSSQYFTIPTHTKIAGTNDDACDCNKSNERLISPVIDLSSVTSAILKVDVFYLEGSYNNIYETGKIEISTNGGSTWSTLATLTGNSDWRTEYFNISTYAGNSNVKIAFYYDDGSDWLFGFAIDNFTIYEPVMFDVAMIDIDMPDYVTMTNQTVQGSIQNYGGTAITSLDLNYSVNNGTTVTQSLTGLNITPLSTYSFTHGTPWLPSAVGSYTIKVWANNLNGNVDMVISNDTMSHGMMVAYNTCQRTPLIEEFTSSTCSPCAYFNVTAGFDQFLADNSVNNPVGNATAVKYQMNWPDPGNDPSYNSHGNSRRTFYGVSGIPDAYIDGQDVEELDPASGMQQYVDERRNTPAFFEVFANHIISNDTVRVEVKAIPFLNTASTNFKVFISVVEDYYSYPASTTNQDEYHQVMRKMLPSGTGTLYGSVTAYDIKTFSQSSKMTTDPTPPPTQGSFDLWVGMNNIHVVAWVQNTSTLEVFQSEISRACSSSTLSATMVDSVCSAASVNVSGGVSPYTFYWDDAIGQTASTASGLASGTHKVLVIDNNRCFKEVSFTVPSGISAANITATAASCGNSDGALSVQATGGTSPLSYAWSTGGSQSSVTGLGAGLYTVTISDAATCTIISTGQIKAELSNVTSTINDASCQDNNGSITLQVTDGTAPYTYQWSNGGSTSSIASISGGNYAVTVTDAGGCVYTNPFTVGTSTVPLIAGTVTSAMQGMQDGAVNITVTQGTSPFSYAWSNSTTSEDLTGVGAGVYTVTVTDAENCQAVKSFTVDEVIGMKEIYELAFNLVLFPNPADKHCVVHFNLMEPVETRLSVYNIAGKTVFSCTLSHVKPGANRFMLDCTGFDPGVYMVEMKAGNKSMVRNLFLTK